MNRFTAMLDACCLYPASLCDLLLSLAGAGLFRVKWTEDIHGEWTRNLIASRPDLTAKLEYRRDEMDRAFPDAMVTGHHDLIGSLALPDPGDRHVLAAAIVARADVIVTNNLKDFPASELDTYSIEAVTPDEFIVYQIGLAPLLACEAVRKQRARLRKPPKTVEEMFATFSAVGLHKTVEELRRYADRL